MENYNTFENEDKNGRLQFEDDIGFCDYGRLPYQVFYDFTSKSDDEINEKKAAQYRLTSNVGASGACVSCFFHESIPLEFRDVVFFHEVTEAEFHLVDKLDESEAHQKAIIETDKYAQKNLSREEFKAFKDWGKNIKI